MVSKNLIKYSSIRYVSAIALSLLLGACQSSYKERQDNFGVKPSSYAEILPEDHSVARQYIPSGEKDSPNSPVAYHTPPSVSYEDLTLDDNLANSLEFADYYKAIQRAGLQYLLQANGPFTVMAIPNDSLESYGRNWKGGLFAPANHQALVYFIKQTIIQGSWSLPRLKKSAKTAGGVVNVKTIAGTRLMLQPLQAGGILVVGSQGDWRLHAGYYPQSNGVLYVSETLPSNHETQSVSLKEAFVPDLTH